MKTLFTFLTNVLFILGITSAALGQASTDKEEKDAFLVKTTDEKGKETVYSFDFSDLEKSLKKLAKQLDEFGESIEETGVEVIQVSKENGITKIEIMEEGEDGKEEKRVLTGKEAEAYLEERKKDNNSRVVIHMDGSLTIDKKGKSEKETFYMELDFEDFFQDLGIDFDYNDDDEQKVIIIRKEK